MQVQSPTMIVMMTGALDVGCVILSWQSFAQSASTANLQHCSSAQLMTMTLRAVIYRRCEARIL